MSTLHGAGLEYDYLDPHDHIPCLGCRRRRHRFDERRFLTPTAPRARVTGALSVVPAAGEVPHPGDLAVRRYTGAIRKLSEDSAAVVPFAAGPANGHQIPHHLAGAAPGDPSTRRHTKTLK